MRVADIKRAVAEAFDVSVAQLEGRNQSQRVAHARHAAMWLCREAGCSATETGRLFGNRDHTTVLHAWNAIHGRVAKVPNFHDRLRLARSKAMGGSAEGSQRDPDREALRAAEYAVRRLMSEIAGALVRKARKNPSQMLRALAELAEIAPAQAAE